VTSSDRDAIVARLETLTKRHGGNLTVEAVVEDARSPGSPLHAKIFAISDTEAAHEHRLELARRLIRSVRVTITVERQALSVVAYVHAPESKSFVPTAPFIDVKERGAETLRVEFEKIAAALERCRTLTETLGLHAEFAKLTADVQALLVQHRRVA
jgi:hypothetical protein